MRDNVSPDKRGGFEDARRDVRELEDEMHGTQWVGNRVRKKMLLRTSLRLWAHKTLGSQEG